MKRRRWVKPSSVRLFCLDLLRNHPELYLIAKANFIAFRAGHLDLAIVEHIACVRLVFDQFVRLDNINPMRAPRRSFRIVLNGSGDVYEFEYQVGGNFVGSQWINRSD
jgi:hypothetical protein